MNRRLLLALLFVFMGVFVCHGARLFEYRGVFHLQGSRGDGYNKISNYVLLKKGSRVKFHISLRTNILKGQVLVTRIRLTSDANINYENPKGIEEFTVLESGIYEVVTEPIGVVGTDELRFLLTVKETDEVELEGVGEEMTPRLDKAEEAVISSISSLVEDREAEIEKLGEAVKDLEERVSEAIISETFKDVGVELGDNLLSTEVEVGELTPYPENFNYLSEELTADSVAADDDYLFGDETVANLDEVASKVLKHSTAAEPVLKVVPRKELHDFSKFIYESSFSVLEHELDFFTAWPQDLAWSGFDLWLLDSQRRRIINFTSSGTLRRAFGQKGTSVGQLGLPVYITVEEDNLYVSDYTNRSLYMFDYAGNLRLALRSDVNTGLKLNNPGSLCFRHGEMWLPDTGTSGILCFDNEHNFLGTFISNAEAPIEEPIIVRADDSYLFVMQKNGHIKVLNPMGTVDKSIDTNCNDVLGFELDHWGKFWLCDGEKGLVKRFDEGGNTLTELDMPENLREKWLPTSISIRADGKVAVSDAANKMIHIFTVK